MEDIPDVSMIGTATDYDQAEMLDYEQRRNVQLEEDNARLRSALMMAREELVFGGDWETTRRIIDAALAKAKGNE